MLRAQTSASSHHPQRSTTTTTTSAHCTTSYTEHYTGMGMDRTETGTLLLKKPGRMRWNYTTLSARSSSSTANSAGSTPRRQSGHPHPRQEARRPALPTALPARPYPAQKELDNLAVVPDGSDFRISGIPKGMAQRVKLLSLTVSAAGSIEKMRLEEVDGSITEFTFTAMRESVSIPDSTFTFTAPAGVAVVDGLPPI
jgi:outer membrane lipoprotein carrier protein